MAHDASKRQVFLPWLVVALVVACIVAGSLWYGFSSEVKQRIWQDLADRPGGPMSFRLILQPSMAALAALRDGVEDAKAGRSPYFWTLLGGRAERRPRLREGVISTARILLLGLVMDAVYQFMVLDTLSGRGCRRRAAARFHSLSAPARSLRARRAVVAHAQVR